MLHPCTAASEMQVMQLHPSSLTLNPAACLPIHVWLLSRYEGRLAAEREAGLRLKGENGTMKKKFGTLQKEIDDQRAEMAQLFEHKKELYAVRIALLFKERCIPCLSRLRLVVKGDFC